MYHLLWDPQIKILEKLADVSRKKNMCICLVEIESHYLALNCPETHGIDQASLRLVADLHASASRVVGLQVYAIIHSSENVRILTKFLTVEST